MNHEFTYFKFVCELIDAGIWAKMSPAARTLYPVLLRFTDRNFSPVYPGTKKLLELTGFKQKSSLRNARKELIELGLISITLGTGRKNTIYHFRFDWIPPRGTQKDPGGGQQNTIYDNNKISPIGTKNEPPQTQNAVLPYNQIQISINNQVPYREVHEQKIDSKEKQEDPFLKLREEFGSREVDLAISEAKLGDLPVNPETIYKILSKKYSKSSNLEEILNELKYKISEGSFELIQNAFIQERNGYFIFSDELPLYLKNILVKLSEKILFDSVNPKTNLAIRNSWRKYEC